MFFPHLSSNRVAPISTTAHSPHIGSGAGYCSPTDSQEQLRKRACLLDSVTRKMGSTCDREIHLLFFILRGAMASFVVSSALYKHNETGNHTETRAGSMNGNFALDDALLVKLVTNTSKQCQKSVTDCVAAQSVAAQVGLDNLCEIIDGRPSGIDTLISQREMVFPFTEHVSEELFRQYCRPGGPLSSQNEESLKQYVSRRRRC